MNIRSEEIEQNQRFQTFSSSSYRFVWFESTYVASETLLSGIIIHPSTSTASLDHDHHLLSTTTEHSPQPSTSPPPSLPPSSNSSLPRQLTCSTLSCLLPSLYRHSLYLLPCAHILLFHTITCSYLNLTLPLRLIRPQPSCPQ